MPSPINTRAQINPDQPAFNRSNPRHPGLSPSALQRELDTIASQIEGLGSTRASASSGFEATDISTALSRFRVGNTTLAPGQSVDLNVEVTEAYEQAGLFLSFGGLDLPGFYASASYTISLGGPRGSLDVDFPSGAQIADIAAAISSRQEITGVSARLSGTGIVLNSENYGSSEFVSVEFSGGLATNRPNTGIYQFNTQQVDGANPSTLTTFADGIPVTDLGQDLAATVNGQPAQTDGALITYTGQFLTAQFELKLGALAKGETANASNTGSFLAAQILYADPAGPLSSTPPGIDINA